MIVLVTGRRLLMIHGAFASAGGGGRSSEEHTFCLVDWQVEFNIIVWIEADEGALQSTWISSSLSGGESGLNQGRRRVTQGDGEGRGGGGHEGGVETGMTVSIYHFPDIYPAEMNGAGFGKNARILLRIKPDFALEGLCWYPTHVVISVVGHSTDHPMTCAGTGG